MPEESEETPLLPLPLLVREGWGRRSCVLWEGEERGGGVGWCMGCIPPLIMGWETWEAGRYEIALWASLRASSVWC